MLNSHGTLPAAQQHQSALPAVLNHLKQLTLHIQRVICALVLVVPASLA
jgi:hypothetical protein